MLFIDSNQAGQRAAIRANRECGRRTFSAGVKTAQPSVKSPARKQCSQRRELAAPVPQKFDFGMTERRPLMPLGMVAVILNLTSRQVLTLIEEGKLRWAFDIRCAQADRREVRVLRQSLIEFTNWPARVLTKIKRDPAAEFLRVVDLILPRGVVIQPAAANVCRLQPGAANDFHLKTRVAIAEFGKSLLPQEPVLRGTEVAQCFSCLSQHVLNLLKEQTLGTVNLRRGPKASPLITRASLVEFLRARRMS